MSRNSPGRGTESSSHNLPHLGDVSARQLLCGQDEQDAEGAEAMQEQPQQHRHKVQAQPTD